MGRNVMLQLKIGESSTKPVTRKKRTPAVRKELTDKGKEARQTWTQQWVDIVIPDTVIPDDVFDLRWITQIPGLKPHDELRLIELGDPAMTAAAYLTVAPSVSIELTKTTLSALFEEEEEEMDGVDGYGD